MFSEKYTRRELCVHVLMYLVGIVVLPLGVVLTINSHFGAGGLDALNFAFGDWLHIPTSISIYILGAIYTCLAGVLRKKSPRWTVMITSLLQGGFTGIWKILLAGVESTGLLSAVLMFLAGNLIVAMTAGPYFLSLFPTNPIDDLTKAVSELGLRISFAKIILECCGAGLAFLLHGEISIGTALTILLLGPMIDFFSVLTKKMLKKWNIRY